jgi:hypothetical protein
LSNSTESAGEVPQAPLPSPSVDWRTEAIRWLRRRAADQACVNASYPRHVADYKHWALLADQYMRAAEELEAEQAAAPYGCGYPYCGGIAPECKTCKNERAAPQG